MWRRCGQRFPKPAKARRSPSLSTRIASFPKCSWEETQSFLCWRTRWHPQNRMDSCGTPSCHLHPSSTLFAFSHQPFLPLSSLIFIVILFTKLRESSWSCTVLLCGCYFAVNERCYTTEGISLWQVWRQRDCGGGGGGGGGHAVGLHRCH